MTKRITALFLTLVTLLSLVAVPANAATSLEEAMAEVNVYARNDDLNWLRVNGAVKTQHYTFYLYRSEQTGQTKEIPAYCTDPRLYGVPALVPEGTSIKYGADGTVTDPKIMGICANGYPHIDLATLGVQSVEEAYYATKTALWCYLLSTWDISKLSVNPNADQAAAQRVLKATQDIYYRGMQWDKLVEPKLTATPDRDTAYAATVNGESVYQQIFTVTSETWSIEPVVLSLASGAPSGTKILDMSNNEVSRLNIADATHGDDGYSWQVKVVYPASAVAGEDGTVQLNMNSVVVQYELFHAKCLETDVYGNAQRYVLDTDPHTPIAASAISTYSSAAPSENPTPSSGETAIKIRKLEKGTNTPLAGAVFEVKYPDGSAVGSVSTGSDGTVTIPVTVTGNYTVTETASAKNHLLPDVRTQSVTVTHGHTATVTFTNAPYGNIRVEKVSDTGEKLGGVTVQIKHIATGATQSAQTNSAGVAEFGQLPIGGYEVRETAGIEGWQFDGDTVQTVAVTTGETSTVTFVNKELPGLRVIKYDRTDEQRLVSFDDDVKTYYLTKYARTNQNTSINIKPIVRRGDHVTFGQIMTEGYATQNGDLALGRNLKVAFMPWKGYNYEDAIVISERIVKEDLFTSIHIEEFTLEVRDTKRGLEELTNDIPNVSTDATKDLDEHGIIRVGAEVKEGDILVGKITPKGESDPTPEEKLLRAIFGDKAGDVKNASLKAGPSMKGVVIGKRLFSRLQKDRKARAKDKEDIAKIDAACQKELGALKDVLVEKLMTLLNGRTSNGVYNNFKENLIPKKAKFTAKALYEIDYLSVNPNKWTSDEKINKMIGAIIDNYTVKHKEIEGRYNREKYVASVGDELPNGIVQMAKVYVAKKRKLMIGDKMAGRHGNKGIVSKIVRAEDMPFLADGTPVDIVLNPLGVPSRMNLGQIYETVLGWAGHELGLKFATPIFDGATLDEINAYMAKAGLPANGRMQLYDGETGEPFDQPATVGYIYMLKLHHMVDDKMHARSIGPYSLITQQPLGGKAQFGGQRFGEMEVWALEAFGASNVLQEILTVKSDDVNGRAKAYEAIVKGDNMPIPGIPESFNVLIHELRGLGLEITFKDKEGRVLN